MLSKCNWRQVSLVLLKMSLVWTIFETKIFYRLVKVSKNYKNVEFIQIICQNLLKSVWSLRSSIKFKVLLPLILLYNYQPMISSKSKASNFIWKVFQIFSVWNSWLACFPNSIRICFKTWIWTMNLTGIWTNRP